jgi:hypothetical protein
LSATNRPENPLDRFFRFTHRARRITLTGLLLAAGLAGCGRETYLERFDESKRYFAYEDKLNQYLTRVAWAGKSFQMRVPKQFQPIADKPKKGEETEEQKDPRQPNFPGVDLEYPGLQGAWHANFPLTGGSGTGEGYLYVCSNFDLLAKKADEGRAKAFNGEVSLRSATAFGQQATTKKLSEQQLFEIPSKAEEAWVEKKKFHVLSPGIPAIVNDKPYRVRIFSYKKENSPAQVCVVYVLPDNIVNASSLDKGIDLSLETLLVTQDKPRPTTNKGGAKAGKGKAAGAGAL